MFQIKKIAGIETLFIDYPSPSTSINILIKTGSNYETLTNNGISHFLEHVFFKGSKKYPTSRIQSAVIDEVGGVLNAYTSENHTCFYVKTANEHSLKGLDMITDMIGNPLFPEDEIEKEKGVIIQEIMMYEDRPSRLVFDKWKKFFYGDNPYGRPILGPVENIKRFKSQDFFDHVNNAYTKDNMLVVVTGNIEKQEEMEKIIGENMKNVSEKNIIHTSPLEWSNPATKEDCYKKWTEQTSIVIWWFGVDMYDEDKYKLQIMSTILGGNMSSRLFQKIREEKGLCYYVYSMIDTDEEFGSFIVSAGLDKNNFQEGKNLIMEEIDKLWKKGITDKEFEKNLGYIRWKIAMKLETVDDIGDFYGVQYLFKKKIESLEDIGKKYNQIKKEDIDKIAKKHLNLDGLFSYWIE